MLIKTIRYGTLLLLSFLLVRITSGRQAHEGVLGVWRLDLKKSTDTDPWRAITLEIRRDGQQITMIRTWKAGRYSQRDSMTVTTGGVKNQVPLRPGKWMEHVHLGAYVGPKTVREVVAEWKEQDRVLVLSSRYVLETSQGHKEITIERRFSVSADGAELLMTEKRSTRVSGPPLLYVYRRSKA